MVELGRKVCVWLDTNTIQILETIQRQQGFPEKENAIAWLIHEWVEQEPYRQAETNELVKVVPSSDIAEFAKAQPTLLGSRKTGKLVKTQPKLLGRKTDELTKTSALLREELEAIYKLSRLQQEILLKLFSETEGHRAVKWTPREWFGAKHPAERAAFSTSLKRLEIRGLVKRQSADKTAQPKRTALVKLTNLGFRVAKRLTTSY